MHGRGACVVGDMCGRGCAWQGACVAGEGVSFFGYFNKPVGMDFMNSGVEMVKLLPRRGRCAWQGGMCGTGRAWQWGGMCGKGACMAGGHVWHGACMAVRWGACVARGQGGMRDRGCAWQILRDTVNEWVVRILLECIPVINAFQNNS